MSNLIQDFLNSKSTKNVAIVMIGRMISAVLGFLAAIIIAKGLGPKGFGIFSLLIVVMKLIAELTGGSINQAIVKFSSSYLQKEKEKAELTFKIGFKIEIIIGLALLLMGFILREPLSHIVFKETKLENLTILIFIGAVGIIFMRYELAVLQSLQTFTKHVLLEIINNFIKLVVIGFLFIVQIITSLNSVIAYVIIPYLTCLLGLIFIPRTFFYAKGTQKTIVFDLIHFSKCIMLSSIIIAIHSRLDILLLNYFKGSQVVGVYSAAHIIASSLELFAIALLTVVYPKVSRFSERAEYIKFYTKFFITTIPLSFFVCIFFWFASQPLILTFYTSDYINSIPILKILVIGSSFFLIALPLCSIILSLNKPQILVAVDLLVLIVMLAGNLLLIPVYGAIGAGIAVLFSKLVFLIIIVVLVIKEVSKIPV
jgi:O-antigen/teichoic acid export membrane protein